MKQALKQLYTYPLQSFLITLALALGIAVIVAVYTVININANSDDSLWQRELILQDAQIAPSKKQVPLRKITDNNKEILTFSEVDLMAVKKSVPNLDYGYIEVEWKLNLEQNKISIPINVTFVSRDYISATNLQVEKGSLMSESDFTNQRPVILLTAEDARKLTSNIVGHEIIAQDFRGTKATLTVIGILKPNTSKTAILPYGAIAIDSPLRTLKFAVNDIKVMPSAIELLSVFTQKTWGDHVTITTISDNKISKLISIVVFAFASTTLLVASLNIMNLMLARVLRHTRDIGIRRVLGASQLNIMYWFLAESLVLGILGGLLGILISYGFVNIFLSNVIGFDGTSGNSSLFTWHSVLVGIVIAVITSFLIGFYPSLRASRLPIIQSLKDTM